MIEAANWKDVQGWRWPAFSPSEMACRGDGSLKIDEAFMDKLQTLREVVGFPLFVNSGYRSEAYNATLTDSVAHDAHTQGCAVDLGVMGSQAFVVLRAAMQIGFTGIGMAQKGEPSKRYVHLDTALPSETAPRPWVWTYNAAEVAHG